MEEFLWVEKYRPKTVSECILPDRLKTPFQEYVNRKTIPNLLLTGGAGVGKTTVAKAMCNEIGLSYMHINASRENGIDTLRTKIVNYASTVSLSGTRKVIILDEADGLTPSAQEAFRGTIEEFSSNCSFILTCNFKNKLIEPMHSRSAVIDFSLRPDEKPKMASAFFKRLGEILDKEQVTYDKAVLVKIVEKYFPDFRRTLGQLQHFASTGPIDASTLTQVTDVKKINELVAALKTKNFKDMRKWVVLNSDVEASQIFRKVYDGLYDYMKPEYIPQAVIILGRYQFQAGFVADQEINTTAALTEIMVECELL
jgi:DNA polymerase III delta prime subunit